MEMNENDVNVYNYYQLYVLYKAGDEFKPITWQRIPSPSMTRFPYIDFILETCSVKSHADIIHIVSMSPPHVSIKCFRVQAAVPPPFTQSTSILHCVC